MVLILESLDQNHWRPGLERRVNFHYFYWQNGSVALEVAFVRARVRNWTPLKGIEFELSFDPEL